MSNTDRFIVQPVRHYFICTCQITAATSISNIIFIFLTAHNSNIYSLYITTKNSHQTTNYFLQLQIACSKAPVNLTDINPLSSHSDTVPQVLFFYWSKNLHRVYGSRCFSSQTQASGYYNCVQHAFRQPKQHQHQYNTVKKLIAFNVTDEQ